jgi:hypothetical protein
MGGQPVSRPPYDRWHDADGTHVPDRCRVEQTAVATEHGAVPSRLSKQGEVTGRRGYRVHVQFDRESKVASVRPHLLRVLSTFAPQHHANGEEAQDNDR